MQVGELHHLKKNFLKHLILVSLLMGSSIIGLIPGVALCADITIAWDANNESDLAGYILFYGTSSRSYSNSIDVGNNTQYTLTGLIDGTTYYFAAKAYNTFDIKSDHSKELVYTLPVANSAPNTPAKPTGPNSGFIQTSYGFDTSGTDPDGDLLTYRFNWGDGNISARGGADSRTHAFSSVGTYCIKAQSQDTHGASSVWSACLNVSIDVQKDTISASAGLNGSISPSGSVTVNNGASQSFSIIPNQNYHVADVMVDGSSVGSVTTYTFNNVDRNHTIIASFAMDNQPPVSNVGTDKTVWLSDTVQLDGSNSRDADGDSLTYKWSIVSKPSGSNATLSNTTAVKPTFVADVAGTYSVQLIVNDGAVNSAPDTVTISTENSAPVSDAGADQTILVNDSLQLDGSGSSDLDGDRLTFKWSFVSRPSGSSAMLSDTKAMKPTFEVDVAGSYTVQLIVNDGTVNGMPDTVTISTEYSAPVANAGVDQAVRINDTVQLDGSGSSDVDGNSLTFKWSLVSKPGGSNATLSDTNVVKPTFEVDVAGSYTVQLIVNDGTVKSAPDTVTISTENSAPVSDAGAGQAVLVNDTVQLDGSASSDVDGDTLNFKWSIVYKPGGSNATISNTNVNKTTFVLDVAGTYTLQLIVNDGTVNSTPDTVTISTENSAPVSNAGADQAVQVNDTVQLDGNDSSDADGDTLTFKWSIVYKPDGSSATLSDTEALKPTFEVDIPGTYSLQLIVNDGTDNSTPDTATIITANSTPVSNAGADQTVEEGTPVLLSGSVSTDPDHNIVDYAWNQIGGPAVTLSTPDKSETTFVAPQVLPIREKLTFKLTVTDAGGLSDVDTCVVEITKPAAVDSDGEGVPDDQDAFPSDPTETIDSDDDGLGNNADPDDDNDGMTDIWELSNGLDALKDDASADLDGDGISNLDEYLSETESTTDDAGVSPDAPILISPFDNDPVALRPTLIVDEFYDADSGDFHSESEWQIFWTLNKNSKFVFELLSSTALTLLEVPSLVLDANKDYSWRVRFYDNHGQASEWSVFGYFTTLQNTSDLDENGVPDNQEVDPSVDLDGNGIPDADEINIISVRVKGKKDKLIGLGTQDASKAANIISLHSADPSDQQLYPEMTALPGMMPFGLIDFKVLVETPGDQAELTVYFSQEAPPGSVWYKYDSVQNTWIEFYDYAVLSPSRMSLTLYLQDGGPGDADGVANGVIVDPSGLVSPSSLDTSAPENDSSGSSGSGSSGCFINSLREISGKEIESKSYWVMIEFLFLLLAAHTCVRQSTKNHIHT